METRVSFFIVAGYLVPGLIFGFTLSPLVLYLLSKHGYPTWFPLAMASLKSDAAVVVIITFVGFCLLACALAMGVFLSDLNFALLGLIRLLPWNSEQKMFKEWSSSTDLVDLLGKDWSLREAYVLALTQGPDIYGYAARNRMLGASGFAVLFAGVIYLLGQWLATSMALMVLGGIFIVTGAYLVRKYREWVAAYAALFLVTDRLVNTRQEGARAGENKL